MKFSITIPAYKRTYLKEAIDSCLAQTYQDFELIIVNDASPEDLDSIVNLYSDERIRYFKNETNIGGKDLVASWNKCLSLARGEYFALLCDDDLYEPTFLEELFKLANKYPECIVFRSGVKHIDGSGNITGFFPTCPEWESGIEYLIHLTAGYRFQTISELMYRRKDFIEIGGYYSLPKAWAADRLSVLRASLVGGISSTPQKLVSFRTSGINVSGEKDKYIREKVCANAEFTRWINNIADQQGNPISDIIKRNRSKTERAEMTSYLTMSNFNDFLFLWKNHKSEKYHIESRCFYKALYQKLANKLKNG